MTTYTISAPAKGGYRATHETMAEALADAARLLSGIREVDGELVDLQFSADDLVTADGAQIGYPGVTYCYTNTLDCVRHSDGAYAVSITEVSGCHYCGLSDADDGATCAIDGGGWAHENCRANTVSGSITEGE